MKVGDLVKPSKPSERTAKLGIIVDFDSDNDPIIIWSIKDPEDGKISGWKVAEFCNSVELL